MSELLLEGDHSLQPYEVTLRSGEVKSWQWRLGIPKTDGKGKTVAAVGMLAIQFHHPLQGKIPPLHVTSLAARPAGKPWTSPALLVRNGLSRGEILKLQFQPGLPLGKWDPGSFQVSQASAESDGTQYLTLADTAPDPATSRRPTLLPLVKDIDLHTTESYEWELGNRSARLRAEIQYALSRGNLFELSIKLPKTFPAYQSESLELQPPEMLRGWHPSGDDLVVELKQPLTPTKKAIVKLLLQARYSEIASGARLFAYPELQPLDAARRQGAVAIHVDPALQPQLLAATLPLAPPEESVLTAPSFRFTFHDQPCSATLRLAALPAQVRWHGKHAVTLSESQAALTFRWEIEPLLGAPEQLDIRLAPGFPASWRMKPEESTLKVHHRERLYLQEALPHLLQLGSRNPAQAALLEAMLPVGSLWRIHLTEPLRSKASLVIEAAAPVGLIEDDWRRAALLLPQSDPWTLLNAAASGGFAAKLGRHEELGDPLDDAGASGEPRSNDCRRFG